jgi:exosortase/archaeosortase
MCATLVYLCHTIELISIWGELGIDIGAPMDSRVIRFGVGVPTYESKRKEILW